MVEHSGRLNAGHYTAYVKVRPNIGMLNNFLQMGEVNPMEHLRKYVDKNLYRELEAEEATAEGVEDVIVPPGRWFHISDNRVSEVTETTVQHAQAYLLFYERIYWDSFYIIWFGTFYELLFLSILSRLWAVAILSAT